MILYKLKRLLNQAASFFILILSGRLAIQFYYLYPASILEIMKKDIYLKVLLTIIAVNLSILSLTQLNVFSSANAEENFRINMEYRLIPTNPDGSVNVRLPDNVISVKLEDVDPYAFNYCTVPVEIEDQPVDVKIDDEPLEVEIYDQPIRVEMD